MRRFSAWETSITLIAVKNLSRGNIGESSSGIVGTNVTDSGAAKSTGLCEQ